MAGFLWLVPAVIAGGYFAFRYFTLKRALRETAQDLREIQQDISRNQILHLPMPDRDLEELLRTINGTLEELRRERLSYEKREKEFQRQIENISHDLRTPLTVILGYLKWLRPSQGSAAVSSWPAQVHQPPDIPEALDTIERNARAMEHLVSQFYAFSCLNGPDFALELETVDLCRILRESLADNYQLLEKPHFHLDCRLPEHPVMMRGNRDALNRIFTNLLQNAGRYAHSFLDIRLEETESGQIGISFQNDSREIAEHDTAYLFERFYRNDAARSKGGSGLGLTIAKSLAEAMGGTLTAEILPLTNRFSGGTDETGTESMITFTLTLTAAQDIL